MYARNHNILGRSGLTTASASASKRAKSKSYYPSPHYDSRSGARVRVVRLSAGQYRVHFKGSGGQAGPGSRRRRASRHDRQHLRPVHPVQLLPGVEPVHRLITCYDALGGAVNASFSV